MKVLFVAMAESVHTARWISQLDGLGELHLFPSKNFGETSAALRNTTVHHLFHAGRRGVDRSVALKGLPLGSKLTANGAVMVFDRLFPERKALRLARLIDRLKPDLVHSLELQHAGYLTLEARKRCRGVFPPWIVTNWGSDISLFGRLPEHEAKIRAVLAAADFYSCECRRDVCLAEAFGFRGKTLPVFPNAGGFDLASLEGLKASGPVSGRRTIMLKGYQHWAGRALVGLRALERCADLLTEYHLAIHSASPDVEIAARLFQQATGVPVTLIAPGTSHPDMLRWHGRSRISLGLSISDGISTSFLEALVMGSFPIQSWTACADEWVTDGITGLLVPPEDPEVIERAIRRALTYDTMVDDAAVTNAQLAREKLDNWVIKSQVESYYKTALSGEHGRTL